MIGSPFEKLVRSTFDGGDSTRHAVTILNTGDDALLARIHLIRSAAKQIDIQTYIWMNDETGRFVFYELIEAAKRGVRVRALLDHWVAGFMPNQTPQLVAFMSTAHENLSVKYYNPLRNLNPSKLELAERGLRDFRGINQRMHNKIFLVDRVVGITGGRNYENDYYDRGGTRNFKDRDAMVIGPVVGDMQRSFDEYWQYDRSIDADALDDIGQAVRAGDTSSFDTKQSFELGNHFDQLDTAASDPAAIRARLVERTLDVSSVRFVADPPGKNVDPGLEGGSLTATELERFLGKADRTIVMQSPYLVLGKAAVDVVKELRRNKPGLDILISTNSLAATDNLYAYSFAHKQRKEFVRDLQFRIFELKPVPKDIGEMLPRYEELIAQLGPEIDPAERKRENQFAHPGVHMCIHAKTYVVDDRAAWVGSFNVDPRSVNLNTETALILEGQAVAEEVRADILRDIAPQNSWTIGARETPPLQDSVRDFLAKIREGASKVKSWPFQYTESFALKDGQETLSCFAPEFYARYEPVGPFPEVPENTREVEIGLLQAFAVAIKPMV